MVFNKTITAPKTVSYKASPLKKLAYIIALSRYIAQQEKISVWLQYREILLLYLIKQLGPMLYYEARLWQRRFSLAEKMRFLNSAQYKQRINELNPPNYRKFSNDKLVEKSILTLLSIPTAKFIGYFHQFNGSDGTGQSLTNVTELTQLLTQHLGEKLCFKLTEGWGGEGFVAVLVTENLGQVQLVLLSAPDNELTVSDFYQQHLAQHYHNGLVIESYIEQHPVLAQLNKSSVNTLRMWLIQHQGKVKVIGAILRVGSAGSMVDSSAQGGILCLIEQKTGCIRHGMTAIVVPETFDKHPDSGVQLAKVQLPFWSECLELGKSCLRVFPQTNFVGLDIAFTKSGPIIIELNLEPDKVSARNFTKPLGDLLANDNITEC